MEIQDVHEPDALLVGQLHGEKRLGNGSVGDVFRFRHEPQEFLLPIESHFDLMGGFLQPEFGCGRPLIQQVRAGVHE